MANGGEVIFKFLGDDSGLKKTLGGVGKVASTAFKGMAVATGAVTAGFTAMVKASVDARGEFEQLEGGVKKIFGPETAKKVQKNAEKAFKTAGLSANKYMEQVTSFSARLIQSTGGDTEKAAEIADMAIRDMADNANTFGTSMESIQNAYQGFAKANYTMLDNLKLGYGGTKQEMERLLQDARELTGVKYDINNLQDIYEAIHVIQEELNVTGTTANEAATTLTGSMQALSASWQNFLSGQGSLGDVVQSFDTAFLNILRIVEDAIPDIMENFNEWLPEVIELGGKIITKIGEGISDNLPQLMASVGDIANEVVNNFTDHDKEIFDAAVEWGLKIVNGIAEKIPDIMETTVKIAGDVVDTFKKHWPDFVETGKNVTKNIGKGLVEAWPDLEGNVLDLITWVVKSWIEFLPSYIEMGYKTIKGICTGLQNGEFNLLKVATDQVGKVLEAIGKGLEEGFSTLIERALNWGRDFLQSFSEGITERLENLKNTVANVVETISSYLHFSRPDVGPLRDYESWMPDMIKGMADSLDKSAPYLLNKVSDLANAMSLSPTINGTSSYRPSMSVSVYNNIEQDPLGQMVNQVKTYSNGAKNDFNYGYGG